MRLHRLEFQAIGPFPERHVIDLDAVGASGLFLLEGPTGAGKSTIIDAIVFALYGDVADSAGAHKSRMHSMHADPGTEPYVDLVFSSSRGVYRVRRTPAHERPKQRGEGMTTVRTSATLTRLPGEDAIALVDAGGGTEGGGPLGEAVSSSTQEIGTEIGTILGMSRDQFTQTVVLPQGQFARFLRADVVTRQKLLRAIFGTRMYDDVEAELSEMAAGAKAAADKAVGLVRERAVVLANDAELTDEAEPLGRADEADSADETAGAERGRVDGAATDESAVGTGAAADVDADADTDPVPSADGEGSGDGTGPDTAAGPRTDPASGEAAPPVVTRAELLDAAAAVDAERVDRLTDTLLARLESDASAAALARADAATRESAARARLQADQRTAELLARRARLLADRDDLARRADAVAADRDALERHGRARTVVASLRAAAARAADAERASTDVAGLVAAAREEDPELTADLDLDRWESHDLRSGLLGALEAEREEASTRAGALAEVVALEDGLAARREALTDAATRIDRLEKELTDARAEAAELPAAREALVAERTAQAELAENLAAAQVAESGAERSLAAARTAQAADETAQAAEKSLATALEAATRAGEAESALRARWREEVSGHLAAGLSPDEPCPVCGSTSHPAPAPPSTEPVTEADLEQAEQERRRADEALASAKEASAAAHQRLDLARESAGGLDVAAAERAHTDALTEVQAARAAGARRAELDEALAAHDRAAGERTASIARSETALAAEKARHETDAERLRADTERVADSRGEHDSVAQRARQISRRSQLASGIAAALSTLGERDRSARQAATEADEALAESGFATADEARAAALEPDAEAAAQERVRAHEADSARVAAGLAEDEVAALTGDEQPDVDGADAALKAAVDELSARTGEERLATARLTRARSAAESLRGEISNHLARLEADRALRRVAELAQGGTASRTGTRLSTYVLLRRFEDVLAAANERLAAMSSGRYQLRRTDEREAGQLKRATGLGLTVLDTFADGARDPRTLSGGETFYVSLSLALGLADVVTAEAGGIELGTLFVDEGFGTLDPDTLDAVMTELGRLRTGGRCVGLISHVSELKQRISDRVTVRHLPSGAGSTLRVAAGT